MTESFTTLIPYSGFDFEFSGRWVPYEAVVSTVDPETSSPEEGGYFDDFEIELEGIDIYPLLNEKAVNEIVELAIEAAIEAAIKSDTIKTAASEDYV